MTSRDREYRRVLLTRERAEELGILRNWELAPPLEEARNPVQVPPIVTPDERLTPLPLPDERERGNEIAEERRSAEEDRETERRRRHG
jgi:hypothetical protein